MEKEKTEKGSIFYLGSGRQAANKNVAALTATIFVPKPAVALVIPVIWVVSAPIAIQSPL